MSSEDVVCLVQFSGRRTGGATCEVKIPASSVSVGFALGAEAVIAALPLTESAASILREQDQLVPYGRGMTVALDENAFVRKQLRKSLRRLVEHEDADSYPSNFIRSDVDNSIPLWVLSRCHRLRLHLWEPRTHVRSAHCRRCLITREAWASRAAFAISVPWIDHEVSRSEELPRPFGSDGRSAPLRLLIDTRNLDATGQEAAALKYLEMIHDSKAVVTARMQEAQPFQTSAVVRPRWRQSDDHSSIWLETDHSELRSGSVGSWSGVNHLAKSVGSVEAALVAIAGRAFHAVASLDEKLIEASSDSTLMHSTLRPSDAVRLAALKLSQGRSIPLVQRDNISAGLLRDHFLLGRAHGRVPRLRRFSAAMLVLEPEGGIGGVPLAAVQSLESRLVHLSLAVENLGRLSYAGTPGVETDVAYHLDHFVLLGQALLENLKWLVGALAGVDHRKHWPPFMSALVDADPATHALWTSSPARSVLSLVNALRVPSAHGEHWRDDITTFGHVAAVSPHRLAMSIGDPAASKITRAIVTLGCNPEDWGVSEAPSNAPGDLAVSLAPYPYSVHLDVHLAWLVNETISRLEVRLSVLDEAVEDYLGTMARANPALDPQWYEPLRLLDWPIPNPARTVPGIQERRETPETN